MSETDDRNSAAPPCCAAKWIMCGDKMPEAGMECVVRVQYNEDDEPFTAIVKYELQKEDSLGWNDYFECDVLAWFPVPNYGGIKLENGNDEHSAAPYCSLTVNVGDQLFEFSSFEQWVARASSWFRNAGVKGDECLCVDAAGRLCRVGKQFMRARDEGTFPVRVYRMEQSLPCPLD